MRSRFPVLLLLALLLTSPLLSQQWYQGRSSSFRVVNDLGDRDTRDSLLRLEQTRAAFGQIFHRQKISVPSTFVVITVRNEAAVHQFVPAIPLGTISAQAQLASGPERDFILMQPSQWESTTAQVARVLLNYNYPPTPAWFNSGFASYLSSIRFTANEMQLGARPTSPKPQPEWIPIKAVLGAPVESTNEQWRYEAWLLTHWIIANSRLSDAGKYFDLSMNRGAPTEEALQRGLGTSLAELDRELRGYAAQAGQKAASYPVPLQADPVSYAVKKIPALEAQITMANMAVDLNAESSAAAMTQLTSIMQNSTDNAAVQRALGYGYIRKGDIGNATEHLRSAIKLDDSDAAMHYWLAVATNGGDPNSIRVDSAEVRLRTMLDTAIRMEPDFAPAHELRGLALLSVDKHEPALRELGRAAALRPRNQRFLLNLAKGKNAAGDFDSARTLLTMLRNSPDEKIAAEAKEAMGEIGRQQKQQARWAEMGISSSTYQDPTDPRWKRKEPEKTNEEIPAKHEEQPDMRKTEYLKGTLLSVDCSSDPGATLSVSSSGKTWSLRVADRRSVLLIGPDNFSCAWRNQKVSVNYKASGAVAGDVISLEFDQAQR